MVEAYGAQRVQGVPEGAKQRHGPKLRRPSFFTFGPKGLFGPLRRTKPPQSVPIGHLTVPMYHYISTTAYHLCTLMYSNVRVFQKAIEALLSFNFMFLSAVSLCFILVSNALSLVFSSIDMDIFISITWMTLVHSCIVLYHRAQSGVLVAQRRFLVCILEGRVACFVLF